MHETVFTPALSGCIATTVGTYEKRSFIQVVYIKYFTTNDNMCSSVYLNPMQRATSCSVYLPQSHNLNLVQYLFMHYTAHKVCWNPRSQVDALCDVYASMPWGRRQCIMLVEGRMVMAVVFTEKCLSDTYPFWRIGHKWAHTQWNG